MVDSIIGDGIWSIYKLNSSFYSCPCYLQEWSSIEKWRRLSHHIISLIKSLREFFQARKGS